MTHQIKLTFIQPEDEELSPVYVNEDFTIEWADYDGESPLSLLGFVLYFSTANKEVLDLDYQTFWDNFELATGKYVVFRNELEEWIGIRQIIELVELIELEPEEPEEE